jgi:hypothetical protein
MRSAVTMRIGSCTPEAQFDSQTGDDNNANHDMTNDDTDSNNNDDQFMDSRELHTTRLLSEPPSSDHSLTYVVTSTGLVIVSNATQDGELYITFQNIDPVDACTKAEELSRTLKMEAGQLFQSSYC